MRPRVLSPLSRWDFRGNEEEATSRKPACVHLATEKSSSNFKIAPAAQFRLPWKPSVNRESWKWPEVCSQGPRAQRSLLCTGVASDGGFRSAALGRASCGRADRRARTIVREWCEHVAKLIISKCPSLGFLEWCRSMFEFRDSEQASLAPAGAATPDAIYYRVVARSIPERHTLLHFPGRGSLQQTAVRE